MLTILIIKQGFGKTPHILIEEGFKQCFGKSNLIAAFFRLNNETLFLPPYFYFQAFVDQLLVLGSDKSLKFFFFLLQTKALLNSGFRQ